jgi:hypothetical protein
MMRRILSAVLFIAACATAQNGNRTSNDREK